MAAINDYFPGRIGREFTDLMLGDYLGGGVARQVYVFRQDPKFVVKFETATRSFQNIREWDLWNDMRDSKLQKWLAPIRSISPSGDILIQARTTPMTKEQLPVKVPSFCTDLKIQNWGLFEGRPVMHDYGIIRQQPLKAGQKKADWWGFEDE